MKTEEIMKQEELSDEQLDNVAGGVAPGVGGLAGSNGDIPNSDPYTPGSDPFSY